MVYEVGTDSTGEYSLLASIYEAFLDAAEHHITSS